MIVSPLAIECIKHQISEFVAEADLRKDEDFHVIKKVVGATLLYKRICVLDVRTRIKRLVALHAQSPGRFSDPITPLDADFSQPQCAGEPVLQFSSEFESGNLKLAAIRNGEYFLCLSQDQGIRGRSPSAPNFFFDFAVKNNLIRGRVKFTIININRAIPLYNSGLRIWTYSANRVIGKKGWRHACQEVEFYPNELYETFREDQDRVPAVARSRESTDATCNERHAKYSLSFIFNFKIDHDCTHFAFNIPYTYTMLTRFLTSTAGEACCRLISLGDSTGGLRCDALVMTSSSSEPKIPIFVVGRVHPSETVSSWKVHGFIEWLLGRSESSKKLLEKFKFTIVPMINPDGVVLGNTRFGITGVDLNRQWLERQCPQIHRLIELMRECHNIGDGIFLDFHGHARRKGFFYFVSSKTVHEGQLFSRITAALTSQEEREWFIAPYCTVGPGSGKRTTARVSSFSDIGVRLAVTVEASAFAGSLGRATLFTPSVLKRIGNLVAESLAYWFEIEPLGSIGIPSRFGDTENNIGLQDSTSLTSEDADSVGDVTDQADDEWSLLEEEMLPTDRSLVECDDFNVNAARSHPKPRRRTRCKSIVSPRSKSMPHRQSCHILPMIRARSIQQQPVVAVCSLHPDQLMIAPRSCVLRT